MVNTWSVRIISKRAHPADPIGPLGKKDVDSVGKPVFSANPIGDTQSYRNAKIGWVKPHELFAITDNDSEVLFHLHFPF